LFLRCVLSAFAPLLAARCAVVSLLLLVRRARARCRSFLRLTSHRFCTHSGKSVDRASNSGRSLRFSSIFGRDLGGHGRVSSDVLTAASLHIIRRRNCAARVLDSGRAGG